MATLTRTPQDVSQENFDLIIIGGGIQGVMFTLEATRWGLKPLLLEQKDFGGGATFNSLRIIHGGFRYLQSLDFSRLKDSAGERRWFLQNFPGLVKPLPCLLPLYGKGLRRVSTLGAAHYLYNFITRNRNDGMPPDLHVLDGRLVSSSEVQSIFTQVDRKGLQGGAVWYDAYVEDSQRLIIEALRIACKKGAAVLNYCGAQELLKDGKQVIGVRAVDRETDNVYTFKAKTVINAAGPWCRELAVKFDRDRPQLFRSMIAWNILFDRKALSTHGVAVKSDKTSHTYFLVPWKGMLLIGTGHAPWSEESRRPLLTNDQISNFIDDINGSIDGLNLRSDDIVHVLPGLQSADRDGGVKLATREVVVDHGQEDGPQGLYSVSGVKFTTSRLVAEKTLNVIFADKKRSPKCALSETQENYPEGSWRYGDDESSEGEEWNTILRSIVEEESVKHLDDVFYRRTTLWSDPKRVKELAPLVCKMMGWDQSRSDEEIERLVNLVDSKLTSC